MKYMRSNVTFGLFWINLVIIVLNFVFIPLLNKNYSFTKFSSNSFHFSGTKEKLLKMNPFYFLEKEFESSNLLQNLIQINFKPINLIFFNVAAVFCLFLLFISFWVTRNECCTTDKTINANFPTGNCNGACNCCNDCHCCEEGHDCKCKIQYEGSRGDNCCGVIIGMILVYLILSIFIAIYYIIIACGKHIVRFSACVSLILLHLSMGGLAICFGTTYGIIVAVFSFINAVINFLGIFLPTRECCDILSYEYNGPKDRTEDYQQSSDSFLLNNKDPLLELSYPEHQEVTQSQITNTGTNNYIEENQGYNSNYSNNYENGGYDTPSPIGE